MGKSGKRSGPSRRPRLLFPWRWITAHQSAGTAGVLPWLLEALAETWGRPSASLVGLPLPPSSFFSAGFEKNVRRLLWRDMAAAGENEAPQPRRRDERFYASPPPSRWLSNARNLRPRPVSSEGPSQRSSGLRKNPPFALFGNSVPWLQPERETLPVTVSLAVREWKDSFRNREPRRMSPSGLGIISLIGSTVL